MRKPNQNTGEKNTKHGAFDRMNFKADLQGGKGHHGITSWNIKILNPKNGGLEDELLVIF